MKSLNLFTKAFAVLLALTMGGCFDTKFELLVNKNGSGTLTQTVFFSQQMTAMMKMAKQAEEGEQPENPLEGMIDKNELARMARELGEGVTVKSAEIVKDDKGREGVKIVFALKDVNGFKIPLGGPTDATGEPMGIQGEAGPTEAENREKETETVTIKFAKAAAGKPATLTVLMPWPEVEEKTETAEKAEQPEEEPDQGGQEQMPPEMMRQMLADMRMRVSVRVDGKITKTNATHLHEDKSGITLVDMDFGRIAADEKLAKHLVRLSQMNSPAEFKKKFSDPALNEFIKFELEREVTVEFE